MGNELLTQKESSWDAMKDQATVLVRSGFMPPSIKTAEQALAIALAGKELGIGFMEAIRSINIIQGKPTISPQLMLALANKTKELENIEVKASNEECSIVIKRKGRIAHETKFGIKEATDLGLIGKDNYRKQAKTMFTWRALAANLRITFPDVVLGLYTPEEMGLNVSVGENEIMEIVPETEPPRPENHPPVPMVEHTISQSVNQIAANATTLNQETMVSEIKDWISVMSKNDQTKMDAMLKDIAHWPIKDSAGNPTGEIGFATFKILENTKKLPWVKRIHGEVAKLYSKYAAS